MATLSSAAACMQLKLIIAFLVAGAFIATTLAQDCFYPNGDLSHNDVPCSTEGGACCPLNWECVSSGMCWLNKDQQFERHSCTDQNWSNPGCPHMCTYNQTATGNEDVAICEVNLNDDDSIWCCNGNGVDRDCCVESDATTFFTAIGTPTTMITAEPPRRTSTPVKITSSSRDRDTEDYPYRTEGSRTTSSSTDTHVAGVFSWTGIEAPSTTSSRASAASTSPPSPATSIDTLTSVVATVPPSSAADASEEEVEAEEANRRRATTILGPSIGVPLGLAALAALLYILHRSLKHKARTTPTPNSRVYFPPDRPVSPAPALSDKAELEGSSAPVNYNKAELEASPAEMPRQPSPVELDATQTLSPRDVRSPVSPMTSMYRNSRFSAVSARTTGGGPEPAGIELQPVRQQHYGPYRPYRRPE